jgi:hypothetical protein
MTKTNKVEDFPIFGSLDQKTFEYMFRKLEGYLQNLSNVLNIDPSRISCSQQTMLEIIDRVEKRRVYFHVFYDGCKMGELNEGALFCYWILKLHPFFYPGMDSNILNAKISRLFRLNGGRVHV